MLPIAPRAKYLPPRLVKLIADAAEAFNLEPADVLARSKGSRLKSRVDARHIVMWAVRETWQPQPSLHETGTLLGGYDHTTVMSAVRRIAREISKESPLGRLALKIAGAPPLLRLVVGGEDAAPSPEALVEREA